MTAVELSVCNVTTAAASLACIFECMRLGMAMAEIIKMMVTTISNSMRENPFSRLFISLSCPVCETGYVFKVAHAYTLHAIPGHRSGMLWSACGLPVRLAFYTQPSE